MVRDEPTGKFRRAGLQIVPVRGGLGNQLFCWAYGRALEAEGYRVIYDDSDSLGRGFALDGLISRKKRVSIPQRLHRLLRSSAIRTLTRTALWEERQDRAPMHFHERPGLTVHWGYWQSLEYFQEVATSLIDEVTVWAGIRRSSETNYCAVHVRRGDYVSNSGASKTLGVLPIKYYEQAMERMRSQGFSRFVVFTDDRAWVNHNLVNVGSGIEISRAGTLMDDFRAIANADAVITANSSFSWWATLTGSRSGRPVISPQSWFADSELWNESIVPSSWERL